MLDQTGFGPGGVFIFRKMVFFFIGIDSAIGRWERSSAELRWSLAGPTFECVGKGEGALVYNLFRNLTREGHTRCFGKSLTRSQATCSMTCWSCFFSIAMV